MTPVFASLVLGLFAVAPPVLPNGKGPLVLDRDTEAVKDRADLFSPTAIAEARRLIDAVPNKQGIDFMIETVTELPGLSASTLRRMRTRESKERLRAVAQTHADEAGCRGLFVLIVKEPRNVTVVGWPVTYELKVSSVKRENLRKYLARELGTDPNRALLGACGHFGEIVKSIQDRPAPPLEPLTALVLIGSLFGAWVLLRFVRSRVLSPALPIYQPAMLGSIFGVPSAYWIYDRLYQAECPPPSQSAPIPALTDQSHEPEPVDIGDLL